MKYSENYEFSLPNKADNDPADIDILSDNFRLIDEILKRHEGFLGNNAKVLDENEVTLETLPSEIPAGVTYCFVNQSSFVDGVWQVGLLVNYNSNRETDAYRIFQVWYGQLENSPMQRKSQLSSGSLVWGKFEKYVIKSDLTMEVETALSEAKESGEFKGEKGDAYTLTEADKQEIAQNATSVCVAKNQGTANVGKILVVGTDGNLTLTDMPEGGASGDVVGVLDEANNILLSGNLADGTYTLKYENTDGTYTEIGTLEVGEIVPEPIRNLADPTSADWQEGYRLSLSSGSTSVLAGHTVTNYIPCKMGDIVRVKGLAISNSDTGGGTSDSPKFIHFDSNKNRLIGAYGTSATNSNQCYGSKVTVNGDISEYTIAIKNNGEQSATDATAYIRFDGLLLEGYTKNDVVITINQEIE